MTTGVNTVVEAFDEIVRPDGGHVRMLAVEGPLLRVHYEPGVNEECASCAIEADALSGMMREMLAEHAPDITSVVVETG